LTPGWISLFIHFLKQKEAHLTLKAISQSVTIISVFLIATGSCCATTYDPTTAFEAGWLAGSNPNGVWTYGFSAGFTNPVTLYDRQASGAVNGSANQTWYSSTTNIGFSPSLAYNNGAAFDNGNVDFLTDELDIVAGVGGQYSDLIFTAPVAGLYSVAGSFRGDQHGVDTAVGIVENGNVSFDSTVTSAGEVVSFDLAGVHLTAGETVVFSVGPNGGDQNTGLSATITGPSDVAPIPEPSSFILIGTGFAGLGGLIRSRFHARSPC
jgi:PEP-CTERM motif